MSSGEKGSKRVTRSTGRDAVSTSEPKARGRSRRTLKKEESIDFSEEGPDKYIGESDSPQMTSDEIEKNMDKLDAACKSFEVEESGDEGDTGDENKESGSSQDDTPQGDLDQSFGSENEGLDSSIVISEEHLNKVSEHMSEDQSENNKRALEDMSVNESDEAMQDLMEENQESPAKEDGQEEYNVDSPTRSDEDQDNNGALEEVSDDNEKKDDSLEFDKSRSLEHDTEMVSEDELPSEVSKPPLDTEAVSDEELPSMVADSLDTEAVSDDEFPQEGKKKKEKKSEYKRNQSNGEAGPPNKRQAIESKSGKPQANSKALPELEKYWKAVRDDSTDFTGWTYLLQYVDQENDVEAAREAYDSFLSHYPYCYGYWRKYADYEKRKGEKTKCEEVFERGLKAIPLSVDLWIHYLNYCKNVYKDDEDHLRSQFERAITVCGLEFRSDRLWESYIKWETEGKNLQRVCEIYDRLITTPTQGYTTHFENFEDFVMSNQPNKILPVDEFLTLRSEVLHELKQKTGLNPAPAPASNAPPGDESDEEEKSPTYADEETTMMREKIIAARKKVFKSTVSCVLARWTFEEGIKRPYFHVKPLERSQLTNWRNYLEFETSEPDQERAIILFERCLIACALYDEFWMKFIRYLESLPQDMTEKVRDVYERACTIHHPRKPMLSLNWAIFEESQGNIDAARQVLLRLESELPNLLHVLSRRINLERRCGNYDEVCTLYDHYISSSDDKTTVNTMVLKYARFCCKVLNDPNKGLEILKRAVEKEKDNVRFYLQMLGMMLGQKETNEDEFVCLINQVLERDSIDLEYKVLFSQRKVEFLEEFGSNVKSLNKANLEYLSFLKQFKDRKRKQHEDKVKQDDIKKSKVEGSSSSHSGVTGPISSSYSSSYSQPGGTSANNSSGPSNQNSSSYQSNTNGTQYQQQSYSQPPFNQYSQSDQNYNNYQNWSYSQPGYGNYNQGWGGYNYYS